MRVHASQHTRSPTLPSPQGVGPRPHRATDETALSPVPPIIHEVLHTAGQALDPAMRTLMETRLGHDFSRVRVHADTSAAASARAVAALAYTVGQHVVFGAGRYAPGTSAGQELLAHELTHVVQQQSMRRRFVARQAVERYETRGIAFQRENFERAAALSYWLARVMDAYEVTSLPGQLADDPETSDAVLSVLWRVRPTDPLTAEKRQRVSIPARAWAPTSKPLLYQFTFRPKAPGDPAAKDRVDIEFLAEGTGAVPVAAPKPKALYTPATSSYSSQHFPGGDTVAYWKAHPQEEKQLFQWVEKFAPLTFDQVMTTQETTTKKKVTTTRQTLFKVTGTKSKAGQVTGLNITFMGTLIPTTEQVPADYRARTDYGDFMLEQAQTQLHPEQHDTLGQVRLPQGLPADEQLAVKYAVATYFKQGTRNAEVDAVIPMPGKTTQVFYTFRFRPNNDVDVDRIGEAGPDAAAGQIDPTKLDVARSPEFAPNSRDVKTLAAWLKARYPLVTVTESSVEEMRRDINAELEAKADKPKWFKNYQITILDETKGKERLQTIHKYRDDQVKDMKVFQPLELKTLESVLETMRRKTLEALRGVRMIRQRLSVEVEADKTLKEHPERGGLTLTMGAQKSIIIFDAGVKSDPTQFVGGKGGVLREDVLIFAHEFGHLVGTAAIEKKFAAFVQKKNIKPITRYATEKPATESFPEAFALFQADPEWVQANLPDLYAWFEELTKTGKPPAL
jgi:hypothetical protein